MESKAFNADTYNFLVELSLNNHKPFFEANRERYIENVKEPMLALAEALAPTMARIDPDFDLRPARVLSRIYRDARRTHGKDPYRDHAWLSYKHTGRSTSESFSMYVAIEPTGYSYGMGCYAPLKSLTGPMRAHMLANPATFLRLVQAPGMRRFLLEEDSYKRDLFPQAPAELKPYLNLRRFSWYWFNADLQPTMGGDAFVKEIQSAMLDMAPLYQFMTFPLSFTP